MIKHFWELVRDISENRRDKIEVAKEKIRADLYRIELYQIEQILGKALGYPYLDHTVCSKCHPVIGCTCGDPQVCVGDHVPETLAMEAATLIKKLRENYA